MTTSPARATIAIEAPRKRLITSRRSSNCSKTSMLTLGPTSMNTLIIGNQPAAQRRADILHTWKTGKPEAAARLDFESLEGAWKLLNAKRWGILRAMAGQGPLA